MPTKAVPSYKEDGFGGRLSQLVHDARQPLQSMRLFLHLLEMRSVNEEQRVLIARLTQALEEGVAQFDALSALLTSAERTGLESLPTTGDAAGNRSEESPALAPASSGRASQGEQPCILVLEDDPLQQAALADLLQDWGYAPLCAESLGAMEMQLETQSDLAPALIITDHRLAGGVSGPEAVAAIRKHFGRPIRAMLITGESLGHLKDVFAVGDLTLMQKPLSPSHLRRAVAGLTGAL
jgi:CheY-like chemotaxis protein